MSLKIVLVGAGSREFGPATLRDIYLSEPLAERKAEVALMDPDADALATTRAYAATLADPPGKGPGHTATTYPARSTTR